MNAPDSARLDHPWDAPPPPGRVIDVAPGIAWLRMPLPFALDHINLWLLRERDGYTLVDCGYGDGPTRALWERHFAETMQGAPLRRILATHYHPDHLGNAEWLAARFACPVAMTQAEFLSAHAIHDQTATYAVADTCALFRRHGLDEAHVAEFAGRGNHYRRGVPEIPRTFERMLAGDRVVAGGRAWQVIPGFGHSPEHAALYAADAGVLISGDMLLPKISTNVSVWASDPLGDPVRLFLESIRRLTDLPDDTLVLPSHGLPFIGIRARVSALAEHHRARLAELEAAATTPVSAFDIVPVLFRRQLDIQQQFFAMGEAVAHLNHAWHQRRLQRTIGSDDVIRFSRISA
jgi:glyoxylase-like metal-dependent hydrolase (beta-lactamase superfamily II)